VGKLAFIQIVGATWLVVFLLVGCFFLQKFNTHFLLKLSWMVLGVGVLGSVEKEEVNDEHI